MAKHTSFGSAFKNIEKRIESSKQQALKRAATSTRAEFAKQVSQEIGLPSKAAKARAKIFKDKNKLSVSIGVAFPVAVHAFKVKRVKLNTAKGIRYGAQINLKNQGKIIAPQGTPVTVSSGKQLVLTRPDNNRSVMKTTKLHIFKPLVEKLRGALQSHMAETFKKNLLSALKFNLKK